MTKHIDLDALQALAEKAPVCEPYCTATGGVVVINGPFPEKQAKALTTYIAACNPQTILSLIACIRELEGKLPKEQPE